MHHHARRLVDDGQPVVFIEDVERDILGRGGLAGDLGQNRPDPLAGFEAVARLAPLRVDGDTAGGDHAAEMDAAVVGEMVDQEDVEPPAGLGRLDR